MAMTWEEGAAGMKFRIELDWRLRQPKDAPYCWSAANFYPCGCAQDDWDDDDYCDDHPYHCWVCDRAGMQRLEYDRTDAARLRDHVEDPAFAARTRWLLHYGWIKTPPMENLTAILREFYITPMIEQLNHSPMLLSALVAEKNALYRPGAE